MVEVVTLPNQKNYSHPHTLKIKTPRMLLWINVYISISVSNSSWIFIVVNIASQDRPGVVNYWAGSSEFFGSFQKCQLKGINSK